MRKMILLVAAFALATNSCKKENTLSPARSGQFGGCIENCYGPGFAGCTNHARGKVEQCFGAGSWMLSVPSGSSASNTVFAAEDLPANFEIAGLDVEFNYSLAGDSIPYICGCGIAGKFSYAQKIRLCSINTAVQPEQ